MKKYILLAFVALAAMSCENQKIEVVNPNEIKVEASLAGSRATLTEFETGDVMGLYAVEYDGEQPLPLQLAGNYINNEPMTYDGANWKGTKTLYWSQNPCDFYGIYPYMELETLSNFLFDIQPDQTGDGYEMSDLMWAIDVNVTKDDTAVRLPFQHLMSRLVVKLVKGEKYEGNLPDEITTHIYNTSTTAIVNLVEGNLEKYAIGDKNTITMRQIAEDTFDAIIVPQHIETNTPLIEVTMGGIAYLLEYSISFRPGYQHTIELTLNTSPDQEKIEIDIDGEIDDWE